MPKKVIKTLKKKQVDPKTWANNTALMDVLTEYGDTERRLMKMVKKVWPRIQMVVDQGANLKVIGDSTKQTIGYKLIGTTPIVNRSIKTLEKKLIQRSIKCTGAEEELDQDDEFEDTLDEEGGDGEVSTPPTVSTPPRSEPETPPPSRPKTPPPVPPRPGIDGVALQGRLVAVGKKLSAIERAAGPRINPMKTEFTQLGPLAGNPLTYKACQDRLDVLERQVDALTNTIGEEKLARQREVQTTATLAMTQAKGFATGRVSLGRPTIAQRTLVTNQTLTALNGLKTEATLDQERVKKKGLLIDSKDKGFRDDVITPIANAVDGWVRVLANPANVTPATIAEVEALIAQLDGPREHYADTTGIKPTDTATLNQRAAKVLAVESRQTDLKNLAAQMRGIIKLNTTPVFEALDALTAVTTDDPEHTRGPATEAGTLLKTEKTRKAVFASATPGNCTNLALAFKTLPEAERGEMLTELIAARKHDEAFMAALRETDVMRARTIGQTFTAVQQSLTVTPSTVEGLNAQIDELQQQSEQLMLNLNKLQQSKTGPMPMSDDEIERSRLDAIAAATLVAERIQYLRGQIDKHPLTEKQIFKGKAQFVGAGMNVLDKAIAHTKDRGKKKILQDTKNLLAERQRAMLAKQGMTQMTNLKEVMGAKKVNKKTRQTLEQLVTGGGLGGLPLSSPSIREEDLVEMVLKDAYTKAGLDPEHVEHEMHDAHINLLNNQTWTPVQKDVTIQHSGLPVTLKSGITPACNLGYNFRDMGGKGVCCHDSQSYNHAVNLAVTDLKDGSGNTMFSSLRHGINSAYGINPRDLLEKDDDDLGTMMTDLLPPEEWVVDKRQPSLPKTLEKFRTDEEFRKDIALKMKTKANDKRAQEVVMAALIKNNAKLLKGLSGETVEVNLNSISLVTPDRIRGRIQGKIEADEETMLKEQMEAWDRLSDQEQPITMKVKGEDGVEHDVKVNVNVTAFNFGVNDGAMNWYGQINKVGGWDTSDGYNTKAIDKILGKANERGGGRFGGQVGKWLVANPDHPEKELITKLATQIQQIWDDKSHQSQGKEPYKMVSRLAVLTNKLGGDCAFNCKSGKDRTGQLDVESKMLATQIQLTGDVPEPDHEMDGTEKSNRLQMALNSGNHEMQQLNTGSMGFKLKGVKALDKSYGEEDEVAVFRGTSEFVES